MRNCRDNVEVSVFGRPTEYDIKLAEQICDAIASDSKGLKRICAENPTFPDRSTIFRWIIKNKDFCDMYEKAKYFQVEALADDLIEIADDNSLDSVENDKGNIVCNSEYVNRSRLKVETRKWIMERLRAKKYGKTINLDTVKENKEIDSARDLVNALKGDR